MTSGIPAKGSALGTSASEGGVRSDRAPMPRTPGNGTRRSRGSSNGTNIQEAGIAETPEASHPALSSSVRTLILGIDYDGRIVQHDRNAAQILARKPEDLLGAQLIELTSAPGPRQGRPGAGPGTRPSGRAAAAVAGLLEAIRSDREGSAMLTIDTRDGHPAEAVVTVHPMKADGTSLAALALLRIPAPNSERFVDPALMRRQMLDDALTRIGDTLDIDDVARVLLDAVVPHFCNVAGLLLLESLAGDDELPSHGTEGSLPMRRIALIHDRKDPAWEATFPTGEILRYPSEHAVLPVHGHRRAGARDDDHQEPGERDRQGLAAQAGGQAALRCLHGGAAAHRARHHARLLRLHPAGGIPPVRRATTSRSAWNSPPGPPCSSTTPAGTAGSTPPP